MTTEVNEEFMRRAYAVSAEELTEFIDRVKEFANDTECPITQDDLTKSFEHPTLQLAARMHIICEDNSPATFLKLMGMALMANALGVPVQEILDNGVPTRH